MALLPELAVQSTFVGAGLHFGFILYLQQAAVYNVRPSLQPIIAAPLLVTVVAAIVTAALLYVIKNRSRVEQFRQTTLLIVAALCFTISGVPFLFEDYLSLHVIATYAAAVAHGITYIAGLSFVNMRVGSRCRSSRLALCHFCYLLGFAIAAQILSQSRGWLHDYGVAQLLSGSLSVALLLVNEVFQFFNVYNYRQCLDGDLQRVNDERVLLYDRKEIIDTLRANAARFPDTVMVVSEVKRRWKLTALLVLVRAHGFMLLVPTLRDELQTILDPHRFWLLHWDAVAGVVVAILMLMFCSAKKVYLLFGVLMMGSLLVTVFMPPVPYGTMLTMFMYYGFLSVLYPIGDIAIADTSEFAHAERNLCIGFAIEKLPIVVVLFVRYYGPGSVAGLDGSSRVWIWRAFAISFLLLSVLLMVLMVYLYTNTRGKSLYHIRKQMMGIRMEKKRTAEEEADDEATNNARNALPPVQYAYNSTTGTYDFPKKTQMPTSPLAMPTLNSPLAGGSGRMAPAGSSAGSAPQTVFFTGTMDNRYERDFQRMAPANVLPRALIGGAIFSSIAWSM